MNKYKIKGYAFLILFGLVTIAACKKKGCTDETALNYNSEAKKDDGSCLFDTENTITFNFSHTIAGVPISLSDFNALSYINADNQTWSITKMQYHISDIRFYTTDGDSIEFNGYHFVDMENAGTITWEHPERLEKGTYSGIGFNFGFDPEDNIGGAYADLNEQSWNSPEIFGGGYHQLKFEGRYINNAETDTLGFTYHSMSTVREIVGDDTTYHDNSVAIRLPISLQIVNNTQIEIKMDINEWFQNPHEWDLDIYDQMLMGNFTAQQLMRANALSVFSIGAVTE